MRRTIIPFLLGIIVSTNPLDLVAAGSGSVRLRVRSGRPIVCRVYLNGHGPYRFLLDTGAETNQVETGIARTIGLKPEFRVELTTATGVVLVPGGHVENMQVGGVQVSGQEFLVGPLDTLQTFDSDIRGVLGQEFLEKFDYLLDLRDKVLRLGTAAPPEGTRILMQTMQGRILLPTNLGQLVLDSGTDTMVLFRTNGGASINLRTASGAGTAFAGEPQRLIIGAHAFREIATVSIPRPQGALEDGLLPLNVFRSVYVSNSHGWVILNPD